jgi:alkanesulfonate monooxygenase SsuD/methylene tetrahydromethanopterin reductase-like flavin-dependent oxidoreductase (luciferase family)
MAIANSSTDLERHLQTYRQTNPQYVRMMDNLSTWLLGTPSQVGDHLAALEQAGASRAMVSVNCELHRQMLPLLADAASLSTPAR